MDWLRAELCCKDKELFIIASEEVGKSRSWSVDLSQKITDEQQSSKLVVNLPPETQNGHHLHFRNEPSGKMLASIEGEESFSAPGLKFIDQDAVSIENTLECEGTQGSVKTESTR